MATNPLPSTVEETLSNCPRFRILVVGNSGVGKSSLVSSIFNISINDIDIAHERVGKANIWREYTSDKNPRFILHDSKGFEATSFENWEIVEAFIREKCDERLPLKDRLHAIWLCILTLRTGTRVLQTADERLLKLGTEHAIKRDAEAAAVQFLNRQIEATQQHFEYVRVSTKADYSGRWNMLEGLTDTTRNCLHDVEEDLWVPWAVAQQLNAKQKVDSSVSEGSKKYWIHLGKSIAFKEQILRSCLLRIHEAIIVIWNFHDPTKLLSDSWFQSKIIKLIEPLMTIESQPGLTITTILSNASNLTSILGIAAGPLAHALLGAGIGLATVKFLFQKYQVIPNTALCLSAYIVDLTVVLHNLFFRILTEEPPRPLKREVVDEVAQLYENSDCEGIHQRLREILSVAAFDPKGKIIDLLNEQLGSRY